jgi:Cu-Zn family superoxide dismutase
MPSIRRTTALVAGPALALALAATVVAGPSATPKGQGTFVDASGAEVGWVKLTEDRTGIVHVNVKVEGLTSGLHGIHIHAVASCATTATTFDGAGGHYNPLGHEHGLENPAGPHAGDLPNLVVDADGAGTLNAKTDRVTLSAGAATLFDANGSAFIIHANPDDQVTNVGNGGSGARIACAVVVPD